MRKECFARLLYRNGSSIKRLYMSGCMNLDATTLEEIVTYAPQVKVLNLSLWQTITGDDLQILTQLTNLRELYLTDCKQIKEKDLVRFLETTESQSLERIDFKGLTPPTSALLAAVSRHPTLRYLNLNYINPFYRGQTYTDADLRKLLESCPDLESLLLNNCVKNKSRETVSRIPRSLPKLKELGLNGCDGLSDKFFNQLAANCRDLEYLSFWNCSFITDAHVK